MSDNTTNGKTEVELRARSVNDFDTKRGLKKALKDAKHRKAFSNRGQVSMSVDLSGLPNAHSMGDEDESSVDTSISGSTMDTQEAADALDWVLPNVDPSISNPQSLEGELKRLQVLRSYLILDSEREASFERITGLASRIFNVPICLVSLVDLGRQWFMSNRGLGNVRETPRRHAFCAHAVVSREDFLIVPDATKDVRFKDNPLVTGPPDIRFYAGAPLISPEGFRLGTLCLIDSKVHPDGLNLEEKQSLRELAALVIERMVERRSNKMKQYQDKSSMMACTAHDLLTSLNGVQLSLSLLLEDGDLKMKLSEPQRDLISTAGSCSEMMKDICYQAIETFRGSVSTKKRGKKRSSISSSENGSNGSTTGTNQASSESGQHSQADKDRPDNNENGKNNGNEKVVQVNSTKSGERVISISNVVKNLQMVMEYYPKSVPLYVSIDPAVPPTLISDDLKIFRSAVNYLTNACSKTKTGSIHLKIFVKESKEDDKRMLVFECEDTGPGVDVTNYKRLFRPFYESDEGKGDELTDTVSCIKLDKKTGEIKSNGVCQTFIQNSGLGLYSVANNVTSIGGDYGYRPRGQNSDGSFDDKNKKKTGSIFWFAVPLVIPNENDKALSDTETESMPPPSVKSEVRAEPRESPNTKNQIGEAKNVRLVAPANIIPINQPNSSHQVVAKKSGGQVDSTEASDVPKIRPRKALVIDDSLVIRKSVSRALKVLGFEVSQAVNGMEGLKMLQESVFDVVLCDFLMPIMDGLDCVQQYRQWEETQRPWFQQFIIGISAHASGNDVGRALEAGMNSFQSKPITLKTIKEIVSGEDLKLVREQLDDAEKKSAAASIQVEPATSEEHGNDDDSTSTHSDKRQRLRRNLGKFPLDDKVVHRDHDGLVCLIAEDSTTVCKVMAAAIKRQGWETSTVDNGEDGLRLLKMRKWDAVFLDDEMPRLTGTRCIERFREWEKSNRVTRQNNVYLVSGNYIPSPTEGTSAVYPTGFDGAIGKPVLMKDIKLLLAAAAQRADTHEIVLR